MSNTTQRPFKCFRLDKTLLERIKEQAIKDKRSIGKEVEYILEQYLLKQE